MSGKYSEIKCMNGAFDRYISGIPKGIPDGIMLFYEFRMKDETVEQSFAVPGGCTDIIFCCGGGEAVARVCGTATKGRRVSYQPGKDYFGIRFLPGSRAGILGYPAKEFTDREVMLEEVSTAWEKDGLPERIYIAGNLHERVAIALEGLKEGLAEVSEPLSAYMSGWITKRVLETGGALGMRQLSEECGYTYRYMAKAFRDDTGITPKLFSRIVRYQKSLDIILSGGTVSLSDIACNLGYFDQSHFLKEFREFSTISPAQMTRISSFYYKSSVS
ncbi:MAG: helix-turn-helix transcriptional regulator [Clostridiales bacterium]|nr:helix-turn-helix transcriptional regulator [Clostridiales bacterium]